MCNIAKLKNVLFYLKFNTFLKYGVIFSFSGLNYKRNLGKKSTSCVICFTGK